MKKKKKGKKITATTWVFLGPASAGSFTGSDGHHHRHHTNRNHHHHTDTGVYLQAGTTDASC